MAWDVKRVEVEGWLAMLLAATLTYLLLPTSWPPKH